MTAPSLGETLRAETEKLQEFIGLLQQEQALLQAADGDGLLPLIDRKTTLTDALARLAQAREEELRRRGLTADRTGMEAWLSRHGEVADRHTWQTLLARATEARELNTLNGKLIGLHMSHNQQAFNALMGATNRAMTYGPDGQQHTGLSGRILGTA